MITKEELIGQQIKIVASKNPANVGIRGKIVDETKNTLVVEANNTRKRLLKSNITILFEKKGLKVSGKLLIGRPEDRLKK